MAEPSTTAVVAATAGVGIASLMPGIDGNALIGSFAGATLFVISAKELGLWVRLAYLIISLIMGYLCAPEITAKTAIEESGVAGFLAGLGCVSVGLWILKKLEEMDLLGILRGMRK